MNVPPVLPFGGIVPVSLLHACLKVQPALRDILRLCGSCKVGSSQMSGCQEAQLIVLQNGEDANTYFFMAQIAFMKQLMTEGVANTTDVVFLDMDALVVDSITEVGISFCCPSSRRVSVVSKSVPRVTRRADVRCILRSRVSNSMHAYM